MANTVLEYSVWRVPVNPNFTNIPYEDRWLFDAPFKTFELGTRLEKAVQQFDAMKLVEPRPVGSISIPTTIKLKSRAVHYGEYKRVPSVKFD